MARQRTVFSCTDCGTHAHQWAGRCPGCGEWNTLVEEAEPVRAAVAAAIAVEAPLPITQVDPTQWKPRPTGVSELDRVLGGGLVAGSVTLVGGEPGIGKSTLLLQAAAAVARQRCAVPLRLGRGVGRAGAGPRRAASTRSVDGLWFSAESDGAGHRRVHRLGRSRLRGRRLHPDDARLRARRHARLGGPGARVRAAARRGATKRRQTATVLVGHVTKDGALAGPRVLEHLVDTVLSFEGDRHHALRLLRAVKHRFGSTDELGLFEMTEQGLIGVPDPSALFLADRRPGVAGFGRRADRRRPPSAARRGAGARWRPRAPAVPAARRRASTPAGWRSWSPCSSSESGSASRASTSTSRWSAACGVDRAGRRPRRRARPRVGAVGARAAGRPRRLRRGRSRRRAPPGRADTTARWPRRARLGFEQLVVPQSAPGVGRGPGAAARRDARRGARPRRSARRRRGCRLVTTRSVTATTIAPWCLVAAPTWCRPFGLSRRARPSRGARPHPAGEDGRAHRRGRRARGAQHLLGRLPARRRLQPAAAVGAGEDGRRHHPGGRRQPHRPGQRAPRAQPERADVRDRHPAPHRRAGRPLDRRPGDLGVRGHGDHRGLRAQREASARGDPPAAQPGQPGAADARALQDPARRGVGRAVRARGRRPRHGARRAVGAAAHRDGAAHRRGDRGLHRRARRRRSARAAAARRAARRRRGRPPPRRARLLPRGRRRARSRTS